MNAADWQNNGIYLGFEIDDPADLSDIPSHSILDEPWKLTKEIHNYHGENHILTFGPPGSGKTRRLLLPNLNRLTTWSAVVIDPKGALAVQTATHRRLHGSQIITLDPFGVIEDQHPGLTSRLPYLKSSGLNPLAVLDPASDSFPDDAKTLAEALIKVEEKGERHWSASAQDLVAGLIMAARVEDGPKANMGDIRRMVGLSADALGLLLKAKKPTHEKGYIDLYGRQYPEIAAKLNRFADISSENRELASILSTAQTQTGWLDSRALKADLSAGVYDFGMMKRQPTTVYLILPPRYLETHSAWLRIAIATILMPLLRRRAERVPVLFMLDEFAQLGRIDVIERNLALVREYGVRFWPILQDLSQLQQNYPDRWQSFLGNAGVIHTFAPQDHATRKYLSDLSGQRDYWYETSGSTSGTSQGPHSSHSSGQSSNWAKQQGPQLWENGLGKMDQGQAVLLNKGDVFRSWLPDPEQTGAITLEMKDDTAPNGVRLSYMPPGLLPETKAMLEAARATASGKAASGPAASRLAGSPAAKREPIPESVKVTCVCPHCQGKARVPGDRRIKVTCPHCKREYMYGPHARFRTAEKSRSGIVDNVFQTVRKWL